MPSTSTFSFVIANSLSTQPDGKAPQRVRQSAAEMTASKQLQAVIRKSEVAAVCVQPFSKSHHLSTTVAKAAQRQSCKSSCRSMKALSASAEHLGKTKLREIKHVHHI
ncbi:unnamed protein product [Ceratitis capitata]|uniref:(Mediterranean fruit fly) hypothetical protein n=1 Tax=Ceratitis capitata TaxID=7213 RepID=A0A811V489_CERCA|nr:unnamed protein product [Ceratitis capitata]